MSFDANCTIPATATPCTQLPGSACTMEILYRAPSEIDQNLEHRFLQCATCGAQSSKTCERSDECTTIEHLQSECGPPDVQGCTNANNINLQKEL